MIIKPVVAEASRGSCGTSEGSGGCSGGCNKLDTTDYLQDVPVAPTITDFVEIRFKNTRKAFFKNVNGIPLKAGDVVAVEASPGHDIGVVSLAGEMAREQMRHYGFSEERDEIKKIYRKAKPVDLEKWNEAIVLEEKTMLKARKIAADLNLDMKIGDVEYQGDKTKAIFYYIADDRVDFRQLIRVLAEEFRVRIEMRQIGARQEAGRIGGIGSCGRELCCSTWLTDFVSVSTNSARHQEVSLNPQKLAGQCGKLKCCLNYELSGYMDARKSFPDTSIVLETKEASAYHQKTDVYRRMMWYSFDRDFTGNMVAVPVERVLEIIELNKQGIKVQKLFEATEIREELKELDFRNEVGSDSLTRFDDKKPSGKRKKKRKKKNNNRNNKGNGPKN